MELDPLYEAAVPATIGPLGDPPTSDYLRVLRAELSRSIAPELSSERARDLLDMATALLDYLVARDAAPSAVADAYEVESELRSAVQSSGDAAGAVRAVELTRQAIVAQQGLLDNLERLEKETAHKATQQGTAGRETLIETLGTYLRRRFADGVQVTEIGSPLGGYSKDVFVVHLDGPARPADRIVIRKDVPRGPLESGVGDEFAVLRAMRAAGVPVAAPLWYESDTTVFGNPFMVFEYAVGEIATDFRANIDAKGAENAVRQLAMVLGRIHSVDPYSVPDEADTDRRPLAWHISALIEAFDSQWQRRRAAPMPVIAAALEWMRASIPAADAEPVVIVHGDPTLRNMLFHDAKVTAMLDWETWHIGDAAEDLAYCRDEVESVMDWEAFLAEYRAHGGREVSAKRLDYWSMWKFLRGAITSISLMEAFAGGEAAELRAAFGAMYFTRMCLVEVSTRLDVFCERELSATSR